MARHQMPYELVFKRGGEVPTEVRSWHLDEDAAAREADREADRQREQGFTQVWLAYDLWDHSGKRVRRVRHGVVLQHPAR